jgi:hypothetical protein
VEKIKECMVQTLTPTRKPALDRQPKAVETEDLQTKAVETNPVIQLLPDKILTRLQEFEVDTKDPNAVVRALTLGAMEDSTVDDSVKVRLVRSCAHDNTKAVEAHQSFRQELLQQVEGSPKDATVMTSSDPAASGAQEKRDAVFERLRVHVFGDPQLDRSPNYQTWNSDQLMEVLNVFRTLGMHHGVVQLVDTVDTYHKDLGKPSPWNVEARHLFAYALNRIGDSPRAQQQIEPLTLDGSALGPHGGAGSLSFAGLAEAHTKNARLIEEVIGKVVKGQSIDDREKETVVAIVLALPASQIAGLAERIEKLAAQQNNTEVIRADANTGTLNLNPYRVEEVLKSLNWSTEVLEVARGYALQNALVSARQGFLETGSAYAGLHYLRRVTEREIELTREQIDGKVPTEQKEQMQKEQIDQELELLARLRTYLPSMINNATVAEGGAHPVLAWNRGDILETDLLRGQTEDRLQRNLEKLLLAVDREGEPLKNNPLHKVPGAEGSGWKLGMILRRIETAERLTRAQLAIAEGGDRRFGTPEVIAVRLAATTKVCKQLEERVSQYKDSGSVFGNRERETLLNHHLQTETKGEAQSRWSYTLREAVSSPLPIEIPGSAKAFGGLIQSYITNEQDRKRGGETLRNLGIEEGPLTDDSIGKMQSYIRERFHTSDLMSLTAAAHKDKFDLPQELAYAIGGGANAGRRKGHGCPTSLFSAVELTPGDCRAHAHLLGGFSDLHILKTYRKLSQEALIALIEGKLDDFTKVSGNKIPNLLRTEISQTTAEIFVTGKVNGVYDFQYGQSKDLAAFVERPWNAGDPLTVYEESAGIILIKTAGTTVRAVPAKEANSIQLAAGETAILATKSEEHTFNNRVTYKLKPALETLPGIPPGEQFLEVDRDVLIDYRTCDAFYARAFVPQGAPPQQQSVYDLGNRPLEPLCWSDTGNKKMPVFEGGPINVEQADREISTGGMYMIPCSYSKSPLAYDTLMPVSIKIFGMDVPNLIHDVNPTVVREWYNSWIDRIDDLE